MKTVFCLAGSFSCGIRHRVASKKLIKGKLIQQLENVSL